MYDGHVERFLLSGVERFARERPRFEVLWPPRRRRSGPGMRSKVSREDSFEGVVVFTFSRNVAVIADRDLLVERPDVGVLNCDDTSSPLGGVLLFPRLEMRRLGILCFARCGVPLEGDTDFCFFAGGDAVFG